MITDRHVEGRAVDKNVEQRDSICRGFAEELGRFRFLAGKPTYKDLEELSKKHPALRPLHHSTVHDVLECKYRRIPDWEWVLSFVTICRMYAEKRHARLDQLADVNEWNRRWYLATRSCLDTAPWPITAGPADPRYAGDGDATHALAPAGRARAGAGTGAADRDQRGGDESAGRAAMLAMARHARALGWWQEFGDVVPDWFAVYLSLEPAADLIRTHEARFVPDLLQTGDYARHVLGVAHPGSAAADLDRRVELRMRRRQILDRPEPATLWAIIDEQALHDPRVPAVIMRTQLRRLVQLAEQPNIAIQVIPTGDSTVGGPITILRFPQRELPDVVYLEQLTGGLYPDRPEDIHHYRQVLDRQGIEATKGHATTTILHRILTKT
jgi:hypothetical protein